MLREVVQGLVAALREDTQLRKLLEQSHSPEYCAERVNQIVSYVYKQEGEGLVASLRKDLEDVTAQLQEQKQDYERKLAEQLRDMKEVRWHQEHVLKKVIKLEQQLIVLKEEKSKQAEELVKLREVVDSCRDEEVLELEVVPTDEMSKFQRQLTQELRRVSAELGSAKKLCRVESGKAQDLQDLVRQMQRKAEEQERTAEHRLSQLEMAHQEEVVVLRKRGQKELEELQLSHRLEMRNAEQRKEDMAEELIAGHQDELMRVRTHWESRVRAVEQKMGLSERLVRELQEKTVNLESSRERGVSKGLVDEVGRVSAQLTAKATECSLLRSQITHLARQLTTLQEEHGNMLKTLSETQRRLLGTQEWLVKVALEAQSKYQSLEASRVEEEKKWKTRQLELVKTVQILQDEVSILAGAESRAEEVLGQLMCRSKRFAAREEELSLQLANSETQRKILEETLRGLELQLDVFRKRVIQLEEERQGLSNEQSLRQKMKTLEVEKHLLEANNEILRTDFAELSRQYRWIATSGKRLAKQNRSNIMERLGETRLSA